MPFSRIWRFGAPLSKNKRKRKDRQILGLCSGTKKNCGKSGWRYTYCSWSVWNSLQVLDKETGGIGNQRKNQNHQYHCNAKISKNTEKSPGDLRRLSLSLLDSKFNNNNNNNNNTLETSKCKLCGDRDEKVNHIIRERNKLLQKGNTEADMTGLERWSTGNCAKD